MLAFCAFPEGRLRTVPAKELCCWLGKDLLPGLVNEPSELVSHVLTAAPNTKFFGFFAFLQLYVILKQKPWQTHLDKVSGKEP